MNARLLCCLAALGASAAAQTASYKIEADSRGVWSFVAPDGSRFVSLGVNNVTPAAWNPRDGTTYYDAAKRQFAGDVDAWGRATRELLHKHGFNTIGAWSSNKVPAGDGVHRTIVLYVAAHAQQRCLSGFRPDFAEFVRANIRTALADHPDRSSLLGVFLDNEAPWYGRFGWPTGANFSLLERALELEAANPAHAAAVELLRSRHKTLSAFNAAWNLELKDWSELTADALQTSSGSGPEEDRSAFIKLAAERFFPTAARVVREELPGVLILGVRYAGNAPDPVVVEDGKVSDVISLNDYRPDPAPDLYHIARFWKLGRRPIMITEFAWRARENQSDNPNSRGAGAVLEKQADRARCYESYVRELMTIPVIVGAHWFEFADQSPQGRFDGEDSNYGIVDLQNRPYSELLSAMRRTHDTVPDIRAHDPRPLPTSPAPKSRVTFATAQRPDRPPRVNLLAAATHEPEVWGAPDGKIAYRRDGETLLIEYDAGESYGGGLNLFGPAALRLPKGPDEATDLDGYSAIEIEFEAPRGLQLSLVLAEAACAPPGQPRYDVGAGDDGEAYVSEPFFGKGSKARARVAIADLLPNLHFGNQRGKRNIDTAALRNLGIQLQGRPRTGTVAIHSMELVR